MDNSQYINNHAEYHQGDTDSCQDYPEHAKGCAPHTPDDMTPWPPVLLGAAACWSLSFLISFVLSHCSQLSFAFFLILELYKFSITFKTTMP
jgi:hypothetical protein